MNWKLKYLYLFIFITTYTCLYSQNNKRIDLISASINLGHHSIGWPFSFRIPFHFNGQIEANWNLNYLKPNRQYITTLGFTNRPNYSNDFYVLVMYQPQRALFKEKIYFVSRLGLGALMTNHTNQIFVFKNGVYEPKKINAKWSGLVNLGFEISVPLNDNFKMGIAYDWRPQIPQGGGLPFLPHSYYNLRLTKIFKR